MEIVGYFYKEKPSGRKEQWVSVKLSDGSYMTMSKAAYDRRN